MIHLARTLQVIRHAAGPCVIALQCLSNESSHIGVGLVGTGWPVLARGRQLPAAGSFCWSFPG